MMVESARSRTRMQRKLWVGRIYGCVTAVVAVLGLVALLIPGSSASAKQEPVTWPEEPMEVMAVIREPEFESQMLEEEQDESVYEVEAKPRKVLNYLGTYKITGYDACVECCGKDDGITASGEKATVGRTIAADTRFPFGTVLYIEGLGELVVEDRGVEGNVIDVFCEDHAACYAITGRYEVYEVTEVWE